MAMSLAFHIVFAALGIGMSLLMAFAEEIYLRTDQPVYLDLCNPPAVPEDSRSLTTPEVICEAPFCEPLKVYDRRRPCKRVKV